MKNLLSTLVFCLITLSGFSQPAKYSFEEVSYSPSEKTKAITVHSSEIENAQGRPKYKVTANIDIQNNKVLGDAIFVYENGKPGVTCLTTVTHVSHLNLGTPNTGGVEAYACRNKTSNIVFYFLAGATTPDTLKFLIYVPSGPTWLQAAK